MLVAKPHQIQFDSKESIIDYVSRGLPPTKKNYQLLKEKIQNPDNEYSDVTPGKDVIINEDLFNGINRQEFEEILDRVYKNQVRNRNITIGILGTVAIVCIAGGVHHHIEEKKEEKENTKIEVYEF